MGGAATLKMVAHYDDYNGMFEVDLWQEGKGFILDHEYNYGLDPVRREALVPALSRNERDHFLDACYLLFGPLESAAFRKKPRTSASWLLSPPSQNSPGWQIMVG